MRLLSGPWQLHDVRDAEALCRTVLDRVLRGWGAHLRPDDEKDALSYLLERIWVLSQRYDPTRSSLAFSTYASEILERRVVDWYRKRFGDARYSSRPQDLSLDELREHLDREIAREESDEGSVREQSDLLTRLACAITSAFEPAAEQEKQWVAYLTPAEAA